MYSDASVIPSKSRNFKESSVKGEGELTGKAEKICIPNLARIVEFEKLSKE